jgi:hypothetical protein
MSSRWVSPMLVLPSGCGVVRFITGSLLFHQQRGSAGRRLSLDCYQKMMAQFADSSSPQDVADLIHA